MITVTVEHILSIKPILQEAAHMPMSARDSYRLMRVLKVLDKEYETIETTQRNLIERCAERDEDGNYVPAEGGNGIKLKTEMIAEYHTELSNLIQTEIELDIKKLPWSMFEEQKITPVQMNLLADLLEDLDEE